MTKKLMADSVQNRKLRDVERFRGRRYSERQEINRRKELSLFEKQQTHDAILEMHEKQQIKRKLLEMSKKLACKDNVDEKIELYEQETAKMYELIEDLKRKE